MFPIRIYPKDQTAKYLILDAALIIFFIATILVSASGISLGAKIVIIFAFLTVYYIALWHRDWRLLAAALAGLAILTLAGILAGTGMLFFGFAFADMIARAKKKWHIGVTMTFIPIMFLTVLWNEAGGSFGFESPYLLAVMVIQTVYPVLIFFVEKSKNLQAELKEVNTKFVQQEERQRIARDLHDTLGHTLTMIKLKTELTARFADKDPGKVKSELGDILSTTRTALKQVRELVSDMNFISLKEELYHSRQLLQSASVSVELDDRCPKLMLPSVTETMLALCLREAITNILRHSNAQSCRIEADCTPHAYRLEIMDDGIGLSDKGIGNGIPSIKERMSSIGGKAVIDSSPEGGASITLELPLEIGELELMR